MMRFTRAISWRNSRRLIQLGSLALFLWLFSSTPGFSDTTPFLHPSLFFQLDPLAAVVAMLTGRAWIWAFVPAVVLLAMTLVFGRFFCGWICPLGSLLDIFHHVIRPRARCLRRVFRAIKYILLVTLLVAALFRLSLVGYFDPLSILTRAIVAVGPSRISVVVSIASWVSIGLLLGILALEFVERRFWCRNLCPLGALLALFSRWPLWHRRPPRVCTDCGACSSLCRMGAFDEQNRLTPSACNLCMDCVSECTHHRAHFSFVNPARLVALPPPELSRRAFLTACAAGVALPVVPMVMGIGRPSRSSLIRPPGVTDEQQFLDRCIRCGQCLKACPTGALQPAALQSGWEGLFSPRLMPRVGYCDYDCITCGSVCPSHAIPVLTLEHKREQRMGIAVIDKSRCRAFFEGQECTVCADHCPVPHNAIRFRTVEVVDQDGGLTRRRQPHVAHRYCIGCGICEYVCPVSGPAAIQIRPQVKGAANRSMQRRRQGR